MIANSCRVCLTKTKKLRSLYKPIDEGDEPPNKMLHLVTGIKVEKLEEYETLPKNICKNCVLSLNMAFEFRENALKTHQTISSYLKQSHENDVEKKNKPTISLYKNEYEEIMNLETMDCGDELEDDVQNLNNYQHKYSSENDEESHHTPNDDNEEFGQKHEQVEDEIYNEHEKSSFIDDSKENDEEENTIEDYFENDNENDEDVNKEDERSMSDNQQDTEYTKEQLEILRADEEYYICNKKSIINIKSIKPIKKKILKISTKFDKPKGKLYGINLTENKIIPRRGRKPSNNPNQNGHICDICGNVFAKRGRMMEHRQRHDKESRFSCEICDKKCLTRELLRKHMFSHSGGKPLKCEFCSRTFYYESVRKAHESVHKGLRPYVCDICGKSFSYAHALKKHKLIHAEIKLYRCDYCNKDFRLQHHMKQHELTKLHQNAVRFAKSCTISLDECGEIIKEDLNEDILLIEEIADDQLAGES